MPLAKKKGSGGLFSKPDPSQQPFRNISPLSEGLGKEYCNNAVINSRYTALNFLPKNLYEQFRRPLNMYFLFVSCLQFIKIIAPVNPLSTLLPLLFAFSFTALKEGYDDVKRHRQDDEYNSRRFDVLRGGTWRTVQSKDIIVGDVVKVVRNQEFPCDLIGIAAPDATIFIRTDNLDGEIDLKPRDRVCIFKTNDSERPEETSADTTQALSSAPTPMEVQRAVNGLTLRYPPPSAIISSFDARIESNYSPAATTGSGDEMVAGGGGGGDDSVIPLSHSHLLLQSSYLKNTAWVFGIAVYTGNETKCGMNKSDPPNKWCKLDQQVSNYSKIIFGFQMLVAFTFGIIGFFENRAKRKEKWYITGGLEDTNDWDWVIFPGRFFLLTSVMIPISFKFVVDMSKYFMSLILEWDLEMYDYARDLGMKVKNSSIVEDLARIEYVLSDKTGTITQNLMTLVACSLNGSRYTGLHTNSYTAPESESGRQAWKDFFMALAVCNTVEVEGVPGELSYAAPSPDEEALTTAAASLGVTLTTRTKNSLTIQMGGFGGMSNQNSSVFAAQSTNIGKSVSPTMPNPPAHLGEREFTVHEVFGFTSERKRMSIVLQEHRDGHLTDHILLVTKGADDMMLERLIEPLGRQNADSKGKASLQHLQEFASIGLRTLVVAQRSMSMIEYNAWKEKYEKAKGAIEGRSEAVWKLQDELERGMTFLGITAIEDKLQENVEKTLRDLIEANVKVWMLTGDKVATARQISLSCGLCNKQDRCIMLDPDSREGADGQWQQQLLDCPVPKSSGKKPPSLVPSFTAGPPSSRSDMSRDLLVARESRGSNTGYGSAREGNRLSMADVNSLSESGETVLVVHGECVETILKNPDLKEKFIEITSKCKSVVCARVTPSQKAKVTAMVAEQGKTTLAIGDGGNDVAMIQEAHVGVGIMGKEGQQAARAADFSISQFQYLTTLMFVHGHLSYKRTCYVVQYSFYKSMLISFVQLVFNTGMTLVSGVSYWNSFSLTMWNGCYTLPQTLFYCLDRCAPRESLVENPSLYRLCQSGYGQTKFSFFGFILRGMLQAVGVMLISSLFFGYGYINPHNGATESTAVSFTGSYSTLILLQLVTVIVESNTMTWVNLVGLFGMPLVYFVFTIAYGSVKNFEYYGVFQRTINMPFFLTVLCFAAILFIPHFIILCARKGFFPNYAEKCRQFAVEEQRRMARAIIRHRLNGGGGRSSTSLDRGTGSGPSGLTFWETTKLRIQFLLTAVWEVDVRGQRQGGSVHQPDMNIDP